MSYRSKRLPNEITINNNIASMKLYNDKGMVSGITIFDAKFIDYIKPYKWFKINNHNYVSCHFLDENKIRKMMQLHRYLMYLSNNFNLDSSLDIDHIDGDPLNNLLSNLRTCTTSQNCRNSNRKKNSSSQYKGVNFFKRDKKWKAEIYVNGKNLFLGLFINEIDAAKAYDIAAKKYFGEFARLNGI